VRAETRKNATQKN